MLPSHQVMQFVPYRRNPEDYIRQNGREFWIHDGKTIPVIFLENLYRKTAGKNEGMMVHIRAASKEACLVVDEAAGQKSIVEKALPGLFGNHFKFYSGISGCSILGDGTVCLLLDVEILIKLAGKGDRV